MRLFVAQFLFEILPGIGEPNLSNFTADFIVNFAGTFVSYCIEVVVAKAQCVPFPFVLSVYITSKHLVSIHGDLGYAGDFCELLLVFPIIRCPDDQMP